MLILNMHPNNFRSFRIKPKQTAFSNGTVTSGFFPKMYYDGVFFRRIGSLQFRNVEFSEKFFKFLLTSKSSILLGGAKPEYLLFLKEFIFSPQFYSEVQVQQLWNLNNKFWKGLRFVRTASWKIMGEIGSMTSLRGAPLPRGCEMKLSP